MQDHDLVWYACYGSNLHRERFLCYLQGGTPKNSTKYHTGCRDTTLPRADGPIQIDRPLYFAQKASHWNNGGSCFLGLTSESDNKTLGKKYLVTAQQFLDITRQENNDDTLTFDLEEIIHTGSKIIADVKYGNLLYLGQDTGFPVFSFTSPLPIGKQLINKPDKVYLQTIAQGIIATHNADKETIALYFLSKPGVIENFSKMEIVEILANI